MKMSNFTTGLIAGGVIGAVGLTWALSDGHTRKRMKKDSKRMMNKASDMIENMDFL